MQEQEAGNQKSEVAGQRDNQVQGQWSNVQSREMQDFQLGGVPISNTFLIEQAEQMH